MSNRYPYYVDYFPVGPTNTTARGPLAIPATADELRTTMIADPIFGDTVSCAELRDRDSDCWRGVDRQYPPRYAYALSSSDRARAAAARATCRRRAPALLRICRVGSVRAG